VSISAMKYALDVLDNYVEDPRCEAHRATAVHFLEQAIAEAEKQEQKTPLGVLGLTVFTENRLRNGRVYDVETLQAMTNRDILAIPDMGKKSLKEVLEALDVYASDILQERVDETAKREHEFECPRCGHCCQQREWVEQPDLARVGEVGIWGEEKNT